MKLTNKQYEILRIIDDLYKTFGKFPTYEEISKKYGTTRQDIEHCIERIKPRYEKLTVKKDDNIDIFFALLKTVKTGWVSLKIKLTNSDVTDQKVTYKNNAG